MAAMVIPLCGKMLFPVGMSTVAHFQSFESRVSSERRPTYTRS